MTITLRLLACALLATMMPSLRAASTDATDSTPMQQALILRVDGKLTINPQGVPTDYQIKTELPQNLRDSLQQHIRSWHFEPVIIDGKPVEAQTQMRVILAAETAGDNYRVSVDNVSFPQTQGETPDDSLEPLHPAQISYAGRLKMTYPDAALANSINADVLVSVRLNQKGRVEQAFVTQIGLLNLKGSPKDLHVAAGIFEQQVLADAKTWHFHVSVDQAALARLQSTAPDSIATAFTVQVPIKFRMAGSSSASSRGWQRVIRTPLRRAPWLPPDPGVGSIGVADLRDGELAPTKQDRFRLLTSVAGSVL